MVHLKHVLICREEKHPPKHRLIKKKSILYQEYTNACKYNLLEIQLYYLTVRGKEGYDVKFHRWKMGLQLYISLRSLCYKWCWFLTSRKVPTSWLLLCMESLHTTAWCSNLSKATLAPLKCQAGSHSGSLKQVWIAKTFALDLGFVFSYWRQ